MSSADTQNKEIKQHKFLETALRRITTLKRCVYPLKHISCSAVSARFKRVVLQSVLCVRFWSDGLINTAPINKLVRKYMP